MYYEDFLKLLEHISKKYDPDRSGHVYKQMTALALEENRVKSITYDYVQISKTTGGGAAETHYKKNLKWEKGRSSKETISHSVMAKVTAK